MTLKKYSARAMLSNTTEQLIEKLSGSFILVFDNGEELITNYKETIYSSFLWDFHRKYTYLPMLPEFHVSKLFKHDEKGNYISGNRGDTHRILVNNIYWHLHKLKNNGLLVFDEDLSRE